MPCFGATSEMHWSIRGTSKVGVWCMYLDHYLSTYYSIYIFLLFNKLPYSGKFSKGLISENLNPNFK